LTSDLEGEILILNLFLSVAGKYSYIENMTSTSTL